MFEPSTEILAVAGFILFGVLYSSVGASALAYGEVRARATVESNGSYASTAARWLAASERISARLLAGRVFCVCMAATFASHYALRPQGPGGWWYPYAAAAVVAAVYSAVVEIATTVARKAAPVVAMPLLRYFRFFEALMIPLAGPVAALGRWADRLIPTPRPDGDAGRIVEMEVESVIDRAEESGSIPEELGDLVRGVLEFKDTEAREIMVPRTQMVSIEMETSLEEVVRIVNDSGHSRYPVYRERVDQLVGILYAKDLFTALGSTHISRASMPGRVEPKTLMELVRKAVFYVAESQNIGSVLREMRSRRLHLAIVVDEFGGTSGMVTLEDILEEIVGDIQDEHDTEESPVREIAPGRFLADAAVSVSDLSELLGVELPASDGSYDSLAGMVMEHAGKVPKTGQSVVVGPLEFIVREGDQRQIRQVEIVRRVVA